MDGSDFDPAFISNIFTNNYDGFDYLLRNALDGWYNFPNSDKTFPNSDKTYTFSYVCQFWNNIYNRLCQNNFLFSEWAYIFF